MFMVFLSFLVLIIMIKKNKTGNAKYNRDKKAVIFTKAGSNLANSSPTTLVRLLIHEQLHAHIDEHNLFDKENIVDDLFETYNKFIEAVEHDVNYGDRNSERYSLAVNIKKWIEDNGFTFKDYLNVLKLNKKIIILNFLKMNNVEYLLKNGLLKVYLKVILLSI